MTNKDSQASFRRESWEWFPIYVFGQDRSEICLARLMRPRRFFPGFLPACCLF
jgi:hypothetical protein